MGTRLAARHQADSARSTSSENAMVLKPDALLPLDAACCGDGETDLNSDDVDGCMISSVCSGGPLGSMEEILFKTIENSDLINFIYSIGAALCRRRQATQRQHRLPVRRGKGS
jgi:hypothetical protein